MRNLMELKRSCGVLLHITSLPGNYGTGTIGNEALHFADMLNQGGFSYWQILPIGPVTSAYGYSPYATTSTFAGNYHLISMDLLKENSWFPKNLCLKKIQDDFIDFGYVTESKLTFLVIASNNFFKKADIEEITDFNKFCEDCKFWLDDYALYSSLSSYFNTHNWYEWDKDISLRKHDAIEKWTCRLIEDIKFHKFVQYIFFKQWFKLKNYCSAKKIKIIGDVPIYITMSSADAWSHQDIFQLDNKTEKPFAVSGVPPDYFSETGQRWGNPLYNWFDGNNNINERTLSWWAQRIIHLEKLVDVIRIDHFRAFESYWSIPVDEKTAINGKWIKGPGLPFFSKLIEKTGDIPIIAEDLGTITPEVEKMRLELNLPGMRILQFAFDFNSKNSYLPHNFNDQNTILYTGTHDNNTINGWFYEGEIDENTKKYIMEYLNSVNYNDMHWQMICLAYRSVARLAIIPAQDILGYGKKFRMNTPGTKDGNWRWKLLGNEFNSEVMKKMLNLAKIYNRVNDK